MRWYKVIVGMYVCLSLVSLDCCCGDGRGADVNSKDWSGSTPLHSSSELPQLVRLLLEKGANPNVVAVYTGTPISCTYPTPDSIDALLDGGALVMLGESVLCSACLRARSSSTASSRRTMLDPSDRCLVCNTKPCCTQHRGKTTKDGRRFCVTV